LLACWLHRCRLPPAQSPPPPRHPPNSANTATADRTVNTRRNRRQRSSVYDAAKQPHTTKSLP
jgi:hypothetical protein